MRARTEPVAARVENTALLPVCSQEYEAFETLSRLARDFKSAALAYGRVIISERFLPPDEKSIKQTLVGGAVGGDKVNSSARSEQCYKCVCHYR